MHDLTVACGCSDVQVLDDQPLSGKLLGIAVEPDGPAAFAKALCHLADHRNEATAMGRNGRALAESHFRCAQLAEQFVRAVEQSADPAVRGQR